MPPLSHLLIAAIAAFAIAGGARRMRALSISGALAAAFVGFCCFAFAGWPGAISLLLFFGTSTALSRLGKRRKEALNFEKGGERDAAQVLANGGVAALYAVLIALTSDSQWATVAMLGALAEANADTWATEIGALAKGAPRFITTFRLAPTGGSGAISLPGTLAALGGAALIAGVGIVFHAGLSGTLAVVGGGFFGALADSLLGATVQAQYRCFACGILTEQKTHCGSHQTILARGLSGIGNDAVNCLATLVGAGIAVLLYRFL